MNPEYLWAGARVADPQAPRRTGPQGRRDRYLTADITVRMHAAP